MYVEPQRLLEIVRAFVEKEQGSTAPEIELATPLFQEGYIDSFAVVRLIGEVEAGLGLTLPPGALIPEDFASVDVLAQRLAQL